MMALVGRRQSASSRAGADVHEARLLRRAADGDRDRAIGELYDRYAQRLYGFGLRQLQNDGALAEEMVQETFVRLWRSASRFDPARGTVRGYVFTIARNTAVDLHRRRPRGQHVELGELAAEGDAFDQLVTSLTVRDALEALKPTFREVLELTYDHALSQGQIADRLEIPVGTVKSRTYNAMRALRGELVERGVHA